MMKLISLLVVLLFAVPAHAQNLLQIHFKITITDTGSWSGWSKWHPDETFGGSESRTFSVFADDTASIVGDSISQSLDPSGATLTCHVDRAANMLRGVTMSGITSAGGTDGEAYHYTLTADSLPISPIDNSIFKITDGSWTLNVTSSYEWQHPGAPEAFGNSDLTQSYGSGKTAGPIVVTFPYSESAVREPPTDTPLAVILLSDRRIQLAGLSADSRQPIEIFDDLGRSVYQGDAGSQTLDLHRLSAGCYFVRVGRQSARFVLER